jgi:hypothetical protein
METVLTEERQEALNETVGELNQLMQAWEERITLRNLRLAHRCVNLGLKIFLRVIFKHTREERFLGLPRGPTSLFNLPSPGLYRFSPLETPISWKSMSGPAENACIGLSRKWSSRRQTEAAAKIAGTRSGRGVGNPA